MRVPFRCAARSSCLALLLTGYAPRHRGSGKNINCTFVDPDFLRSPRFIRVARRVRAVRSLTLNISATAADVIFPLDDHTYFPFRG